MQKGKESPHFKDRTGEKHITNEGYPIRIIVCTGSGNCDIQFEDGLIIKNLQYSSIKRGYVKNPMHLSVQGIGYMGVGKYSKGTHSKIHDKWNKILCRSYSESYHKTRPTYRDCSVDEQWHNFQNFAKWFEETSIDDFALDKDILIKGNKIYSPETCCFVPLEVNNLLTKSNGSRGKLPIGISKNGKSFQAECQIKGISTYLGTFSTIEDAFQVYKEVKEKEIKRVAEEWKPLIKPNVYQALYNYKVEITD